VALKKHAIKNKQSTGKLQYPEVMLSYFTSYWLEHYEERGN